jgi:hypothetical protein
VDPLGKRRTIPYKKLTLYFMTGTGNSFRTATWMAEAVGAVSFTSSSADPGMLGNSRSLV